MAGYFSGYFAPYFSSVSVTGGFQPTAFQPAFQQTQQQTIGPQEVPAGRSRRFRDIYRITIDGTKFEFRSLAEAIAFLERAKAVAAQKAADEAAKAADQQEQTDVTVPLPTLRAPRIEVSSRELRAAASEARRQIEVVYEKALVDAEIRMLMEINKRVEDNEDIILLLM